MISTTSKSLHYEHKGQTSGPAIIFVHGMGGASSSFTRLIDGLKLDESYSLHLFDLEGHGQSPADSKHIPSMSSYANDLADVFQHAGLQSRPDNIIIAHSMGCHIALSCLLSHPSVRANTKKLVLISASPLLPSDWVRQACRERAELVSSKGMEAVTEDLVSISLSSNSTGRASAAKELRTSLLGTDRHSYGRANLAVANTEESLDLERIDARTLIVTGSEDIIGTPDGCIEIGNKLKHADVALLEGVGHWPTWEDEEGINSAVGKFLEISHTGEGESV